MEAVLHGRKRFDERGYRATLLVGLFDVLRTRRYHLRSFVVGEEGWDISIDENGAGDPARIFARETCRGLTTKGMRYKDNVMDGAESGQTCLEIIDLALELNGLRVLVAVAKACAIKGDELGARATINSAEHRVPRGRVHATAGFEDDCWRPTRYDVERDTASADVD